MDLGDEEEARLPDEFDIDLPISMLSVALSTSFPRLELSFSESKPHDLEEFWESFEPLIFCSFSLGWLLEDFD